jgi:hypothetical protein
MLLVVGSVFSSTIHLCTNIFALAVKNASSREEGYARQIPDTGGKGTDLVNRVRKSVDIQSERASLFESNAAVRQNSKRFTHPSNSHYHIFITPIEFLCPLLPGLTVGLFSSAFSSELFVNTMSVA